MERAVYETEVPTVLAAGLEPDGVDVEAFPWGDASLETVPSADDALESLSSDRVDCLLVGSALEDATVAELVAEARDRWRDLPILAVPETGSVAGARDATAAGATCYLPLDVTEPEAVVESVSEAVETYDERRQEGRERNMFTELLSNTPLSVYFKDAEGRHVCASAEATAYRDDSLLGKTDYDLYADDIGEEEAREAYEDDLHVIEEEEPIVDKEERHVTHEDDVMWLRTTKVPWRDEDGEVRGLIGITRNVSEVKQREVELEQEKRRLEQFASFVSHDLRNPVNIAKGYLQQAMEADDEEALEEVVVSLDRMDRMIDDLLHMARPDDEQEMGEWTAVREVAQRTWDAVGTDRATVEVAVPDGVELMGTSGALRQVFENLFKNAIDHGGRDVTVEVGLTKNGFYVEDDGPGVPPADREAIFEYGYTTDGTGVGLAIVKEIADAHGWTTTVTAADDGGARFEFGRCIRRPPATRELPAEYGESVPLDEQTNVDGARPVGDATRDGPDAWTVRGGGTNVWAEVEEYYAVHGDFEGDLRIEGRLASLESIHEYSKACLFVASAVETGVPFVAGGLTASHGAETCWRSDPNDVIASKQYDHMDAMPLWIRLDRIGDRVTIYTSRNGSDWDVLDQHVAVLPEDVAVGLFVSSHNEQRLCAASVDDVRVVPIEVAEDDEPRRDASNEE